MPNSNKVTHILFLCWGYSIHAQRRIQLFIGDPKFKVTVVSTFDYNFASANNVTLSSKKKRVDNLNSNNINKKAEKNKNNKRSKKINIYKNIKSRILFPIKLFIEIYHAFQDFSVLKATVKKQSPDVIFLQTLLYPAYLSFFLSRNKSLIITFWNGDLTWWAKWKGIERLFKKYIVKHGIKRADAISVNSNAAVQKCVELGSQEQKITLIPYPGVDLNIFQPSNKLESREKLSISSKFVILCPRGFADYLNNSTVVKALGKVINNYPDTLLLFISDVNTGGGWEQLLNLATKLNIQDKLRWDGRVTWLDMPKYYSAADVMVSLSSNDSLPNCMLEAMACSTTVIMGDIPQISDWIEDGDNGFLCPVKSADVLAEKLITIFENNSVINPKFFKKNIDQILARADSEKNAKLIKDLVIKVANVTHC